MKKVIIIFGIAEPFAVAIANKLCKLNTKDIIVIGDTEPEYARINVFRPEPEPIVYKALPRIPELINWKDKNGKPFEEPKSKYHK